MKGNIVLEARKVVKELYNEGHQEIFALSIVGEKDNVTIQVADFSLEPENLDSTYVRTYTQAKRLLSLAKSRYGANCKAINSLICDETKEEVWFDRGVLRVCNLNA